ncbi:hypothetical protein CAPTEDRAFT_223144 [Capitella teleta]|uniref:Pentacotripeptide-repeat region of PRORP domain-containing protein n=1 Tax=Capitella teleta TaxID=283909 RepID=R7V979_CAPTE|nr:hypothetical protein CAPTEDRAFT_223144 [Capitella teleta]|eukprot:ELU12916.1 hypothetical protein CAPTEDRAFT_223144 [Capitella teleta]
MLRVFRPALAVRSRCRHFSSKVQLRNPMPICSAQKSYMRIPKASSIFIPSRSLISSTQDLQPSDPKKKSRSIEQHLPASQDQFIEQFQECVHRAQMQLASYSHVDLWTADKLLSLYELCPIGCLKEKDILVLLQALGEELIERLPEERGKIFDNLWKEMDQAGVIYSTTIFNQRMKTMLDNKTEFDPVNILNEMNNLCIPANRRTYQLMIQRYCQMGHLDEAHELFSKLMKEKIALSPRMYQYVMSAYILQGEEAEAEEVLESSYSNLAQINSELDLRRDPATYAAQVISFAAVGKLSKIKKVLKTAKEHDIVLGDQVFYSAIVSALENNHHDLVTEIIDTMLKFSSDYYLDLKHLLTWLINNRHDYLAISLVRRVTGGGDNFYKHIMRCMVLRKRPVPEILEVGKQFSFTNIKDMPTTVLVWSIWLTRDPQYAAEMLFHLPRTENIQRFWKSLFAETPQLNEAEDILRVARFIVSSGNSFPVAAFFSGIMNPLMRLGFDYSSTLSILGTYGLGKKEKRMMQRIVDLAEGKLCRANQFTNIYARVVIGMFGVTLGSHQNPAVLFKLLVKILPTYEEPDVMLSSIVLGAVKGTLAYCNRDNKAEISQQVDTILSLVKEHDQVILKKTQYPLITELARSGILTRYLKELVVSLTEPTSKKIINFDQMESLSLAEVESLCRVTNELEAQAWLLVKLCESEDVHQAQSLEKDLNAQNYKFPPFALKALAMMHADKLGNIEQALIYLAKLEADYPDFNTYISLIIKIAELLVKDREFTNAMDVLSLGPDVVRGEGAAAYHGAVQLCDVTLSEYGVTSMMNVVRFLIKRGFIIGKYRKDLADHVTIALIKREDSEGVLQCCKQMHEALGVVPMSMAVCNFYIRLRQDASLNEVMNLMSTSEPLNDVRLRIIVLLVEAGNKDAAVDLTTDPDFRENSVLTLAFCKYFLDAYNNDILMKEFINVLKVIPGRKDTLLCGLG